MPETLEAESKKTPEAPTVEVRDLESVPMRDVSDLGSETNPHDIEQARERARILVEESGARKKAMVVAAAGTAVAGGVGYGLVKSGAAVPMVGAYVAWKSLPLVDWFANKLDKWSNKLIKKNMPFGLGTAAGLLADGMDWIKMKIAPEKSLFEYIKKNKDERKKLAEKALKDLRAEEKKLFKKQDDAAKKKSRADKLSKKLGKDTAALILDEIDDIEGAEASAVEVPVAEKAA